MTPGAGNSKDPRRLRVNDDTPWATKAAEKLIRTAAQHGQDKC